MHLQRTYEHPDHEALLRVRGDQTGLAFVEAVCRGDLPGTAFASTVGMTVVEVAKGRVRYRLRCLPHLANAMAGLHGGAIATLCDGAAGFAVITVLGPDEWFTTMDLHTRMLRGTPLDGREIFALGEVVKRGRRTALAEVRVTDADGKLLATASSSCLIVPRQPQP